MTLLKRWCVNFPILNLNILAMIAQWENECITLSPLPMAPGHDSSVEERLYLTVCPPCGLGHDNSVGESMYRTVSPPYGPGHDSSVEERLYLTVCPPCGPG